MPDPAAREPIATRCTNHVAAAPPLSFAEALALERALLADAARSATASIPLRSVALWQTEQALILPSGMLRREAYDRAASSFKNLGWPLHERDTGGDLTPQFDGILNVTMTFVLKGGERSIATAYRRLTDPLIDHLARDYGIAASTASVVGAFCDGAYNIVVAGRKLAGTAQRWRLVSTPVSEPGGCQGATAVLAHAAILCSGDLAAALEAGNALLEAAGEARRISPSVHVRLADLAGSDHGTPSALAGALEAYFNRSD